MSLETFIGTYGYPALLVGTFLEGETFLVLAGFAAHQGYMDLPWVILVAFIGTFSGDQLFFYLGRRHSALVQSFLSRNPAWLERADRVNRLIDRYKATLIFGIHFLYGLRIAALLVIGLSRIPAGKFFLINFFSALVWAVGVGTAGYLFGNALDFFVADLKGLEKQVLLGIGTVGGGIALLHFLWRRRGKEGKAREAEGPSE